MDKALSTNFLFTVVIILIFTVITGIVTYNIFQEFISRKCLNENANKFSKLLEVAEEVKSGTRPNPYYYTLKTDWCVACVNSMEAEATDCNAIIVQSSIGRGMGSVLSTINCMRNPVDCVWNTGVYLEECLVCCSKVWGIWSGCAQYFVGYSISPFFFKCKYDATVSKECLECSGVKGSHANGLIIREKMKFVNFGWNEEEKKCDISGSKTYRIKISLEGDYIKVENLGEVR
jgi:hypothetical protein